MNFTFKVLTWLLCFCATVRANPYMKTYDDMEVKQEDGWDLEGVFTECVNMGDFALTFDDGPSHEGTRSVLDVLKEEGVKATFFVNGANSAPIMDPTSQEIIKRIHNEGHEIGCHTWNHKDLTNLTAEEIREEVQTVEVAIREILGLELSIMRPPFGYLNETVVDILVNQLGYAVINWNLDTNDWRHRPNTTASMQAYYEAMEAEDVSHLNSTFIALHHDNQEGANDLAKAAIAYVKEKGYNFVTISECIGKKQSVSTTTDNSPPGPGSSTTDNSLGSKISPIVSVLKMITTLICIKSIWSFQYK